MRQYRVYSRNFPNGVSIITAYMSYGKCQRYIDHMARAGRPTHFYIISSMSYDKVKAKYGE